MTETEFIQSLIPVVTLILGILIERGLSARSKKKEFQRERLMLLYMPLYFALFPAETLGLNNSEPHYNIDRDKIDALIEKYSYLASPKTLALYCTYRASRNEYEYFHEKHEGDMSNVCLSEPSQERAVLDLSKQVHEEYNLLRSAMFKELTLK